MAAYAESDSKGEKITLMVPAMDHDQAERGGGAQPERKRTGLSMFGRKRKTPF